MGRIKAQSQIDLLSIFSVWLLCSSNIILQCDLRSAFQTSRELPVNHKKNTHCAFNVCNKDRQSVVQIRLHLMGCSTGKKNGKRLYCGS